MPPPTKKHGSAKVLKVAPKGQSPADVSHPIDLQTFLPFRMMRLGLQMADSGNKLSELIKEAGVAIGEREWRVLAILGAYGGLTNSQVAEISCLDTSTISRAVKALSEIGFVFTRKSKKDRRRLLICLTPSGADYHDSITPKRIESGEKISSCLTENERAALFRIMDKLERHLIHTETEDDEWE